ncbi:hypothetical protein P5673_005649 [Acropora cervicornis]|uniref:Uncharacterized protein n=1 Tax=Acropora cervicornis TaxID=6130 RepID=A0AAD9QYI5_ACRCE|nr:hypothetical protein P5673_005649 [Acropora cervicornis]
MKLQVQLMYTNLRSGHLVLLPDTLDQLFHLTTKDKNQQKIDGRMNDVEEVIGKITTLSLLSLAQQLRI